MELHEFHLVILLTAPAAEGPTLMRHWEALTGNSGKYTGPICVIRTGFML